MSRFTCLSAALLSALLWLAPHDAVATTVAEACASFGELAEDIIRARDAGVPLSRYMQLVDKVHAKTPNPPAAADQRWLILFVYELSSDTEASWIRNRAELKCFQTLQP